MTNLLKRNKKIGFSVPKSAQSLLLVALLLSLFLTVSFSHAGVFNTPNFVDPKEFALGIEPEVTLESRSGVGVNFRYTHGLSEMNNLIVQIGTGTSPRTFRLGTSFTFDFFPDVNNQPGVGMAIQGLFVQLPNTGSVEATLVPYVHKNFLMKGSKLDPFLAIPVGISLSGGTYQPIVNLAVGGMIHHDKHFRTVLEVGVGLTNVSTYLSGGLTYYH